MVVIHQLKSPLNSQRKTIFDYYTLQIQWIKRIFNSWGSVRLEGLWQLRQTKPIHLRRALEAEPKTWHSTYVDVSCFIAISNVMTMARLWLILQQQNTDKTGRQFKIFQWDDVATTTMQQPIDEKICYRAWLTIRIHTSIRIHIHVVIKDWVNA